MEDELKRVLSGIAFAGLLDRYDLVHLPDNIFELSEFIAKTEHEWRKYVDDIANDEDAMTDEEPWSDYIVEALIQKYGILGTEVK